jgi:SpoIID/LytB domain protein
MSRGTVVFQHGRPYQAGRRLIHRVRFSRAAVLGVALAILLLAGAALPPAAQAADSFVFAGRGNGHGVGMSQWGAWQGAKDGNSFAQILAFYYPGTTLELTEAPNEILQVRISANPPTNNTTSFSQVVLRPTVSPATLVTSPAGQEWIVPVGEAVTVANSGGKVQVTLAGEHLETYNHIELQPGVSEGRVQVELTTSGGTTIDPREYWGALRVQSGDDPGEVWVYNRVALEKYVRSIAEVEYDWAQPSSRFYAPEAVKAQAVAARSYALAKNGTLSDSWADQCYRGYTFEAKYPGIAQAAEATAGLILTYGGKPATTFFSGHSGGYTTDSAWSGTKPAYIIAQPDPWSLAAPPSGTGKGPGWAWTYTISADSLSARVNGSLRDTAGKTVDIGSISHVEVASRDTDDPGSHVRTLRLVGADGTATVSISSFRSLLGTSNLPSTLIVRINGNPGGVFLEPGEFYDVGPGALYRAEISRIVAAGLMSGYGNGLFKPLGTITRSQFAKIAVNLHNATHPNDLIEVVNVTARPFADVPFDSDTMGDASDWIAAAKKAGLVIGMTSTSFSPYTEIRRDQMATMMCRALGWEEEAGALPAGTPGFSDVPRESPHWAAAAYVKQRGIILGYEDPSNPAATVLRVDEAIKRQHVALILCRVLDLVQ